MLSAAQAAAKWTAITSARAGRPWPTDREALLAGFDQWARMYVDGVWSLERFEAHADRMIAWLLDQEAHAPP